MRQCLYPSLWPARRACICRRCCQCTHTRFEILGRAIVLAEAEQLADERHTVQTATSVWDCSVVLAKWLEQPAQLPLVRGRRVIELGAGTGSVPRTSPWQHIAAGCWAWLWG